MPYVIRKMPGKNLYRVSAIDGSIKANATTKKKAEAQVRLLTFLERVKK